MKEIIKLKMKKIPFMPKDIKIKCASFGLMNSEEIEDISEIGIQNIIEKVRKGEYSSLFLSPDEFGDFEYLKLETTVEIDFLFLFFWASD